MGKRKLRLEKKIEALENQGFAQRLLIDELEAKISRMEEKLKNVQTPWSNPVYIPAINYPPPHDCNTQGHVYGLPDAMGNSFCVHCLQPIVKITYTTTCSNSTLVDDKDK